MRQADAPRKNQWSHTPHPPAELRVKRSSTAERSYGWSEAAYLNSVHSTGVAWAAKACPQVVSSIKEPTWKQPQSVTIIKQLDSYRLLSTRYSIPHTPIARPEFITLEYTSRRYSFLLNPPKCLQITGKPQRLLLLAPIVRRGRFGARWLNHPRASRSIIAMHWLCTAIPVFDRPDC